jgi:hypothetical protein
MRGLMKTGTKEELVAICFSACKLNVFDGPMTGETIKVRNVTNPKYNSNVNNIR